MQLQLRTLPTRQPDDWRIVLSAWNPCDPDQMAVSDPQLRRTQMQLQLRTLPTTARRPAHRPVGVEPVRPGSDGPAAVPHVLPVLRGQRRALLPDVPAQRRHGPRRALQHCLLQVIDDLITYLQANL
jgi:hypothetical protein